MSLMLKPGQLDLLRQWFEHMQDTDHGYLEHKDYELASQIYIELRLRVPKSVSSQLMDIKAGQNG